MSVQSPFRPRWLRPAVAIGTAAIAGAVLVPIYALGTLSPAVGLFHDDGVYLVTARALAEGRGYQIISMPGEPPQTKYPILFPWLLSLVWKVAPEFPANLPWLKAVPLTCTVVWLSLSYCLIRRLGIPSLLGLPLVLVAAASPWVVFLATSLMAESLFAALLTGALLLLLEAHSATRPHRTAIACGVLFGAAALTRTIGLPMGLAGALTLLLARRWVAAGWLVTSFSLLLLPWFVWATSRDAIAAAIDPYSAGSVYTRWHILAGHSVAEQFDVLATNAIAFAIAPLQLWTLPSSAWFALVTGGGSMAAVVCGVWRQRRNPVAQVTAVYLFTILVWVWLPFRFLAAIVPQLAWLALEGTGRFRIALVPWVLAVVISASYYLPSRIKEIAVHGTTWPSADLNVQWQPLASLMQWIKRETPPDAILAGSNDPMLFLYTERRAIRAFSIEPYALFYGREGPAYAWPLGSPNRFVRLLVANRVDYLVLTPGEMVPFTEVIAELQRAFPTALTSMYLDDGYEVYRVNRDSLNIGASAVSRN